MLSFLKMMLTPEFFFSILRISAPILFATLGAIVVEKAGFCNIGLEGIMMFAALSGEIRSLAGGDNLCPCKGRQNDFRAFCAHF